MALIHYNFDSRELGRKTDLLVILPDVEWNEKNQGKKYQILYLLHGGGEDYTCYVRYTNIEKWAEKYQLAVVMPDAENSSYMNMVHGDRFYSYISEELPNLMQSVFPLSRSKKDHFVAGFSMGANGTLHWAMDKPEFFQAAAVMSGGSGFGESARYIMPGKADSQADIFHCPFGGIEHLAGSDGDVYMLARKMAETKPREQWPALFSAVGKEDFMYPGSCRFKKYLDSIGVPMELHTGAGGHSWDFWNEWLPKILEWFGLAGTLVEE